MHARYTSRLALALIASFSTAGAVPARGEQPTCLPCHGVKGFSIQAEDGTTVSLYVDPARYRKSVHRQLRCFQCHVNMAIQPHGIVHIDIPTDVEPYLAKWRRELQPATAACITCHRESFDKYRESIHAGSLARGNLEAPFCVDCHGCHYILGTEDLESTTSPRNVPATCASCHAVGLLMSRLDVATNTYETFQQSVHGRKLALGAPGAAVCTSCHGMHDVKSPLDPESRLFPTRIAQTCRECHVGATRQFALSFKHVRPSPTVEPVIFWVQIAYRWVIIITVGGMALYVLFDLLRYLINRARGGEA